MEPNSGQREVRVLGPVEVALGSSVFGPAGRRSRALLAHLVRCAPRWAYTEQLAEVGWGEDQPANPRKAVQMHVLRLRQAVDESLIETGTAGTYRLGRGWTRDVDRFSDLAGVATRQLRDGRCDLAATTAEQALALWRGDPWCDLDDDPDAVADRTALEFTRVRLELVLAESLVCVRPDHAIRLLVRLAPHAVDPDRHARILAHAQRVADGAT